MSSNDQKNVFISHYGEDDDSVQGLKKLLGDNGCTLKNSSIDSTKDNQASSPEYIKTLLGRGIEWAGSMIVLIGPKTHTRDWVNWEIEQAHKMEKPIIGVFIQGAKDSDVPSNFEAYGDALVGWSSGKVIDALNGKCDDFDGVDGTPWNNPRKIDRGGVC